MPSAGRLHSRWIMYAAAILAAALTWILHQRYPYGGANGDDFQYLDIARSWADGRWIDAINGYWSVLLPLMLAPLQALGLGHTDSFGIVGALLSASVVVLIFKIGIELNAHTVSVMIVSLIAGVRASIIAVDTWTPDLLLATIGLAATLLGLRLTFTSRYKQWVVFGLVCGGLYLAKPAGLFTGIVMAMFIVLVVCGSNIRTNLPGSVKRAVCVALGILAVALPLVAVLSWKYGYVTAGSSGGYNLALSATRPSAFPVWYQLWDPAFPKATMAETDPTFMDFHLPYSLFSPEGLDLLWTNATNNISQFMQGHSGVVISLVFCLTAMLVMADRSRSVPVPIIIVTGTVVIHVAAYMPVLFVNRHLILPVFLTAIVTLGVVNALIVSRSWIPRLSLAFAVLASVTLLSGGPNIALGESLLKTAKYRSEQRQTYLELKESVALDDEACERVAVVSNPVGRRFFETRYFVFDNSWYAAGYVQPKWSYETALDELTSHQIDCVFVWENTTVVEGLEDHLTPIVDSGDGVLVVYRFEP